MIQQYYWIKLTYSKQPPMTAILPFWPLWRSEVNGGTVARIICKTAWIWLSFRWEGENFNDSPDILVWRNDETNRHLIHCIYFIIIKAIVRKCWNFQRISNDLPAITQDVGKLTTPMTLKHGWGLIVMYCTNACGVGINTKATKLSVLQMYRCTDVRTSISCRWHPSHLKRCRKCVVII